MIERKDFLVFVVLTAFSLPTNSIAQRPPGKDSLPREIRMRMNSEADARARERAKIPRTNLRGVLRRIETTLLPKIQRTLVVAPAFINPTLANPSADWNAAVCNRSRWMEGANYEWTSVLDPSETLENRVVGISGMVIDDHVSTDDVWFTHPFGYDWNANVAVDPGYEFVFAPGTPASDSEIVSAVAAAPGVIGYPVSNALHIEFDSGFISDYYRAHAGQEFAAFGRWIIDCGHTNFTSEVHPPLLFVKSDGGDNDPAGITHVTVISRPFLSLQTFGGKPFRDHLIDELAKVYSIPLDPVIAGPIFAALYQMQARPDVARVPFRGIKLMSFVVRPQFQRLSSLDHLMVRYSLSTHEGVAVQVVNNGDDSVTVWVVMNDIGYSAYSLPQAKTVTHSLSEIKTKLPDIGGVINKIRAGGAFSLNPLGDVVLEKGFDTDSYQMPVVVEAPLGPFVPIESITPGLGISNSLGAPYPILGSIELKWERH